MFKENATLMKSCIVDNINVTKLEESYIRNGNHEFHDARKMIVSNAKPNYFGLDHIYILNVDHRIDRIATMQRIFEKLNANFTRISAFYKKNYEFLNLYNRVVAKGWKQTAAAYAIKMSHLKVLEDMESKGYETALILEDDVDLDLMIGSILPLLLKKLPVDWGYQYHFKLRFKCPQFLRIYYLSYLKSVTPYPKHNSLIYPMGNAVAGTQALIYRNFRDITHNKTVIQKIREFSEVDIDNPWDYMLAEMFIRDDSYSIKGYGSDFALAEHMGSTIANPSDNKDVPDATWKDEYTANELLSSTFFSLH
ncbi:hypothetical protein HK099_006529 [Clydaea vesicula]|uniref:Glycosyl transferase family 25 domain-containing protein n=1 Tax=Clydaea vesicula TaxID=447962 RepID=A0AAD5XYE7_9FUNG|nr:hypothetical protein HK099_006529 [Clydaea vesicula]